MTLKTTGDNEQLIEMCRNVEIHQLLGKDNRGREVQMQCPFPSHADHDPSFTLYPDNSYYCFGCDKNGQNAIDFCMDMGESFESSVDYLSQFV